MYEQGLQEGDGSGLGSGFRIQDEGICRGGYMPCHGSGFRIQDEGKGRVKRQG